MILNTMPPEYGVGQDPEASLLVAVNEPVPITPQGGKVISSDPANAVKVTNTFLDGTLHVRDADAVTSACK